jgi:hypothetical protein
VDVKCGVMDKPEQLAETVLSPQPSTEPLGIVCIRICRIGLAAFVGYHRHDVTKDDRGRCSPPLVS